MDFDKHIESLRNKKSDIDNLKSEVTNKLGPEICKDIVPLIDKAGQDISELEKDILEIKPIFEFREEVKSQILNPVQENIRDNIADAIKVIKDESISSIQETRWYGKWSIYIALFLALLPLFKNIFDFGLQKLFIPKASYQVGLWSCQERDISKGPGEVWGTGNLSTDPTILNASGPLEVFDICCDVQIAGGILQSIFLCPEDDFPISIPNSSTCTMPESTIHPDSESKNNLAFRYQTTGPLNLIKNTGHVTIFAFPNYKKKDSIKFKLIAEVLVDSGNFGFFKGYLSPFFVSFSKDFEVKKKEKKYERGEF